MTLRKKLLLSYLAIIIICLGIAATSVLFLLKGYRDQVALSRLADVSRPIAVQIRSLLHDQTTLLELLADAQEQAQNNSVFILFVDNQGKLLRAVYPDQDTSQSFDLAAGLPHKLAEPDKGIFSTAGGETFLYAAYPMGKTLSSLPFRTDVLVMCRRQSGTAVILADLVGAFVWAGIIALIVSVVVALFIARSVYRPIRNLSRAAENIARGNFDQEVPVTGTDEIQGLAKNFNSMSRKIKDSHLQLRHFVANVSHQLKSPLTSIQGFGQAILDGTAADNETRQKAAGIIVDESKRMLRQVNELLDLSRMQAGQIKLNRERLNIADIILQCQEILALRLEEKKIVLKNDLGCTGPVSGDPDRLEDVFNNLLDNAIKNTPPQGEIRVSVRQSLNHELEIVIEDSGPGIPPEQIPFVFDRFQQSSGLSAGFGLGLAIAREIVLAHGGNIAVASNPGEGARFTVTLPLSEKSAG